MKKRPTPYAAKTTVPAGRTRQEIEHLLRRHGATRTASLVDDEATVTVLAFGLHGVLIRMTLPLPRSSDRRAAQAERSAWRALLLVIKAKLEAVARGISTVEREFLADIVLPHGGTVEAWLKPQLKIAFDQGTMPKRLAFEPSDA